MTIPMFDPGNRMIGEILHSDVYLTDVCSFHVKIILFRIINYHEICVLTPKWQLKKIDKIDSASVDSLMQ